MGRTSSKISSIQRHILGRKGGNLEGVIALGGVMAFDPTAGDHRFDFIRGVCMRCGISHKKFKDSGRPMCTGQHPAKTKPLTLPDDDDPPEAA
jgi:hypothetical protein